jgi:hypothetical protein
MVCYQVSVRFAFVQHKAFLVSTSIKAQPNVKAFLVNSGLPFGHGLKVNHFFSSQKEAVSFVSYLHTVYKNHMVSAPASSGGQLLLF